MAELPTDSLTNFVFPNEAAHTTWSLMIVIYPYITGLVTGSSVVSALYYVTRMKEFKPIANFALIVAFCFALFTGVPLLNNLGQPQHALNIIITPNTASAMSMFGYAYSAYMALLLVEMWVIYRPFFIRRFNETKGLQRAIWYPLTLGVTSYHYESARLDHKVTSILAGIGIPVICMLHGYAGFIFGSMKAIPWWVAPLQPIIFLTSGSVSGMALLIVMYSFIMWRRGATYDYPMLKKLVTILWVVFCFDWAFEMIELSHTFYQDSHEWHFIHPLVTGPLYIPYFWGQLGVLSVLPAILMGYVALSKAAGKKFLYAANLASVLLLAQVLIMRYCVVIGGQLMSKSERGFVAFEWGFFTKEGVVPALLIMMAPLIVYFILSWILPIFEDPAGGRPTRRKSAQGGVAGAARP